MGSAKVILAIDGGGTGTRVAAFDLEGTLLGQGAAGPSHPATKPRSAAKANLEKACTQARREAGVPPRKIGFVYASLAGAGDHGQYAVGLRRHLAKLSPRAEIVAEGDLRASLWAGLEHSPGVVILAGTGSAAYAEDEQGKSCRVGGWGPEIGDEGSAFVLARRGLQAAAKAVDGRGPKTVLLEALLEATGQKDFRALVQHVRKHLARRRAQFAQLARIVCDGASKGDEVCCELMGRTAAELVEMARAATRRLALAQAPVTWAGSLFRSGHVLLDPVRAELALKAPMLTIQAPHFPPVFGSYLLALRALDVQVTPNMRSRLLRSKLQVRVYSKHPR